MGKNKKQAKYRDGESSSRTFLSPSTGTFTSPIKATRRTGEWASALMILPYAVGVFGVAFLASCLTASIVTPVQNSDATTAIDLNDNAVSYFVNIASATNGTAGVISKDIYATSAGTLGTITDQLSITSNTPNGYKVYVSMSGANNPSRLINTENSEYYFRPIQGNGVIDSEAAASLSNPGTLATANTWGVAVADTWNANFDAVASYTANPIAQSTKFAPVPLAGAEELLITQPSTTTSSTQTDNITVYYGYHATSALPSGTYSNTVLYTAYAEASTNDGGIAAYTGSGLNYRDGGVITITTSLYTDREVKKNDVAVTITDGTNNYTCDITNDAAVTKVSSGTNDSVRIVCTAPDVPKPGTYTLKVDIDGFAHHSQTAILYETDGMKIAGQAERIKTMQGLSTVSNACANWEYNGSTATPDAYTGNNSAGEYKPEWKYGADLSLGMNSVMTDEQAAANWTTIKATAGATNGSALSNINTDVPETYLRDTRDGNYYRIRKLADGNCWMTENLRLVFYSDTATQAGYAQVGIMGSDGVTMTQSTKKVNNETVPVVIDTTNTDISSDAVAQAFGTSVAKTEVAGTNGTANWTHTVWGAESGTKHSTSTSGCANDDGTCSANSMEFSRSYYSNIKAKLGLKDDDEQIVGAFYNWKTATAGTGDLTNTSRSDSICPKGWQLPVTSGDKNWQSLIINEYGGGEYGENNPYGAAIGKATDAGSYIEKVAGARIYAMTQTIRRAPLSLPLSGYYDNSIGGAQNISIRGYFWTNKSISNEEARSNIFYQGYLRPQNNYWKGRGYAVRCVASS